MVVTMRRWINFGIGISSAKMDKGLYNEYYCRWKLGGVYSVR